MSFLSKGKKLTHPTFTDSTLFGALLPVRSVNPLIPYGDTFHPDISDVKKWDELRTWFPIREKNDILITSYPRCGHHFTQKILLEIMRANHNGMYIPDLYKSADMGLNTTPYIEYFGTVLSREEIEERFNLTDNIYPHIWFSHHSFDHLPVRPLSSNNKIITMIRNPKDCIVSQTLYFNYIREYLGMTGYTDDCKQFNIDDYISYFIRGITMYGCYFKWYQSYWNAMNTNKANILWLYYEDVLDNPLENVKKIANFIYDGNDVDDDPQRVLDISSDGYSQILDRISIDSVRKDITDNPQTFELGTQFFRKGINNEWKQYFNEYQSELIDETMYFKWAENCSNIKYYQKLMQTFNDKYNKNYF